MSKDKTLGQRLGDYMVKWARKEGIPVHGPIILQFPNDDVPKYLENLHRFEEASRKTDVRIGAYLPQPSYA